MQKCKECGVINSEDAFPLDPYEWDDTDGDGIGNNADTDDDNDGYADTDDWAPLDSTEWVDSDNDGTGNNADPDDDNDGFYDNIEDVCGSDPLDVSSIPTDTDSDGNCDAIDSDDDGECDLNDRSDGQGLFSNSDALAVGDGWMMDG